jgi:hypothetical protein
MQPVDWRTAMEIVKRVMDLLSGKPANAHGRGARTAPYLKTLSDIARKQGDRIKIQPAPKFGLKRAR